MNSPDPFARPLPFLCGMALCLFFALIIAAERMPAPVLIVEKIVSQQLPAEGAP